MAYTIDTFGWDSIFAIPYDHLNKAFQKNDAKLPDFNNWVCAESEIEITGSWTCFQIATGGSGQDLQMICQLNSVIQTV